MTLVRITPVLDNLFASKGVNFFRNNGVSSIPCSISSVVVIMAQTKWFDLFPMIIL